MSMKLLEIDGKAAPGVRAIESKRANINCAVAEEKKEEAE
jgi:hypothetical protein